MLTDPEQRAKYDNGRLKSSNTRTHSGFGAPPTTASGTRGNPWANAGSQWAPPPKPPPPKDFDRRKPPPPSAGAQRYANFATANGTAPKANQDAEARRKTYQAWESMRQPPPSRAWQPSKPVPKEYTPQSGREESNSYKHQPPPKSSKPGYDEFRAGASQSDRTSPTRPSRKNGFMPGTPGPDEPPASSTSAYFTRAAGRPSNRRQFEAPEPPHRTAPPVDPLRQFREKAGTPFEPRMSTPYATHGGEKTNPFESVNLNRSKSKREPSDKTNSSRAEPSMPGGSGDRHRSASPPRTRHHRNLSPEPGIPRADSEINLGSSPKRTFSSANRTHQPSPSPRAYPRFTPVDPNMSSDGDDSDSDKHQPAFGTRSRTFAKRRAAPPTARPKESQVPSGGPESSTGENDERPRKPSLAEFRQWWSSAEERERDELNDIKLDDTPSSHGNANRDDGTKEDPSMYATPTHSNTFSHSAAKKVSPLPTVLEEHSIKFSHGHIPQAWCKIAASSGAFTPGRKQWPNLVTPVTNDSPPGSPSGAPNLTPPGSLTAFEATQRQVVEELVRYNGFKSKLTVTTHGGPSEPCSKDLRSRIARATLPRVNQELQEVQGIRVRANLSNYNFKRTEFAERPCGCGETGSPFRKHRRGAMSYPAFSQEAEFSTLLNTKSFINADKSCASSFSFNANDETFTSPRPHKTSFSNSAENISTKFTAEDWHGKFEAGDYFVNDGSGVNGRSRTRSGSRTRTRSPVKGWATKKSQAPPIRNIDPEIWQQTTDSEPISSPGGTKFTAEEWARTFKPQNFAPPPYPAGSTSTRPPPRTARRSRTGSSTTRPVNTTRTAGNSAMVDEDESSESPLEMRRRTTQPIATPQANEGVPSAGVDSPNAMDIDPPLEQEYDTPKASRQNGFTTSKDSANEARNVPVEPSRPEWRAGDASGSDVPPVAHKQPELPPRSGNANSRRRTTKSADEEDFKTNFEDLKNVEPLQHPATGLHSFSDLTSTLPFPSRAASTLTIPRNFSSGELDLPNPPRAPMVPPVVNATRPSMSSWESYLLAFKAYMAEWDIFNTKMIMHFVARKNQIDAMKSGWLEAFGDSDLAKYQEGMIEDFKVRQHWDVACEKHQAAIEKFQLFKERLREGVPGTGRGVKNAH